MKFSEDLDNKHLIISAYGDGFLTIDERRYEHSLAVSPTLPPQRWTPGTFDEIEVNSIEALLGSEPEILIIGTGARQHFLSPELLQPIINRNIGFEVMNTAAACRTWNIILGEGRRVSAGLIVETPR